jgi:hypothetical protein
MTEDSPLLPLPLNRVPDRPLGPFGRR